jgi:glycyl-tRNA synthetase
MIDLWRKHFVLTENMLEMECTCLTPEVVLKTSGHVDRFTDLMVKDPATGECFRADKLLEDAIDDLLENNPTMSVDEKEDHLRIQRQADAFSPEELDKLLVKYECKGTSGDAYSPCFPFNLMFKTSIGPEGTAVGFLRPETAQGLFVNFRRLLDANAGKMPFAAAQIGLGFRNGKSQVCREILVLSACTWTHDWLFQKLHLVAVCFASVNSAWVKSNIFLIPMIRVMRTFLL